MVFLNWEKRKSAFGGKNNGKVTENTDFKEVAYLCKLEI